jgi:hypothetical protein
MLVHSHCVGCGNVALHGPPNPTLELSDPLTTGLCRDNSEASGPNEAAISHVPFSHILPPRFFRYKTPCSTFNTSRSWCCLAIS